MCREGEEVNVIHPDCQPDVVDVILHVVVIKTIDWNLKRADENAILGLKIYTLP